MVLAVPLTMMLKIVLEHLGLTLPLARPCSRNDTKHMHSIRFLGPGRSDRGGQLSRAGSNGHQRQRSVEWCCGVALRSPVTPLSTDRDSPRRKPIDISSEEPVISASRPRPRELIFLGMDPRRGPLTGAIRGDQSVHALGADGRDL